MPNVLATPRVLLADDHTMLREGLHRSLTAQGFDIVGEAADGRQAVQLAEKLRPGVVLMDVTMPVLDGIGATRRITRELPDVKVIMLTMHADTRLAQDALGAGAMGYLVKDCAMSDIVLAVHKALRGEQTFPDPTDIPSDNVSPDQPRIITQRESEVLQMIADGKSTTEAARDLYVSVKTVKNHLTSAYAKLNAHDRTQAVLRAARLGLISLHEGPE